MRQITALEIFPLSSTEMMHVKGGAGGGSHSGQNAQGNNTDGNNATNDEKRNPRPGSGGVSTASIIRILLP